MPLPLTWKHAPRTLLGVLTPLLSLAVGVAAAWIAGALLEAPWGVPFYGERRHRYADAARHMTEHPEILASVLIGLAATIASLWIFAGLETKRAERARR